MSYCTRCGYPLHEEEGMTYCQKCGKKITEGKMLPPPYVNDGLVYGHVEEMQGEIEISQAMGNKQKIILGVLIGIVIILQIAIFRELFAQPSRQSDSESKTVANGDIVGGDDLDGQNQDEEDLEDIGTGEEPDERLLANDTSGTWEDSSEETEPQGSVSDELLKEDGTSNKEDESLNEEEEQFNEDDVVISWKDKNLEKAVRRSSGLRGDITVGVARQVKKLDFTGANITDIDDLSMFTGIQELKLGNNYVDNLSPLSEMSNLQILNVEDNNVYDLEPLRGLKSLQRLDLYRNLVTDISPLRGMTKLNMLDIRENRIGDISALSGMKNMRELYISDNDVTDISYLSDMKALYYLGLKNNPIKDISILAYHDNMTTLILQGTKVKDISVVETMPKLGYLDIRNCSIKDSSVVKRLKKKGGIKIEQ